MMGLKSLVTRLVLEAPAWKFDQIVGRGNTVIEIFPHQNPVQENSQNQKSVLEFSPH
jgi:hypothetical protein